MIHVCVCVILEPANRRRYSKPLRCHAALLPAAAVQPARAYVASCTCFDQVVSADYSSNK